MFNIARLKIIRIGINLIPSLSFPLEIKPRIKEPKIEDVTRNTTENNITKSVLTATSVKLIGKELARAVSGIFIASKFFVKTSTKKVLNPNRSGAPKQTATKTKITYKFGWMGL